MTALSFGSLWRNELRAAPEPLSAQKVDDHKEGDDGGNYLAETETAQTMPNRCVRLSV